MYFAVPEEQVTGCLNKFATSRYHDQSKVACGPTPFNSLITAKNQEIPFEKINQEDETYRENDESAQ